MLCLFQGNADGIHVATSIDVPLRIVAFSLRSKGLKSMKMVAYRSQSIQQGSTLFFVGFSIPISVRALGQAHCMCMCSSLTAHSTFNGGFHIFDGALDFIEDERHIPGVKSMRSFPQEKNQDINAEAECLVHRKIMKGLECF